MRKPIVLARVQQLLARMSARKFIPRIERVKAVLLGIETVLTTPFFVISWYACAIFFAIKAGFLMAKAEGAAKPAVLDQLLKRKP